MRSREIVAKGKNARLGRAPRVGGSGAFTVSLTNLTGGEARNGASIGVNITGLVGGETVTYQWTQNGTNISGATSSTFTPNIGTNITDNNTLRCVATIDGTPYTSNGAPARYAPGTFGALSNQSFTENTGNQTYVFAAATGTGLTWTYALTSPPAGVTIVSATRTITFDTDALAIQAGTVITVTAIDQYGRAGTGSPRTFNLAITEDISVDPVISSDSFAASGSGNRATWTVEGSYAGADTLVLEGVTGTDPITVSAAQLTAGSGGSNTLEFFSIDPFTFSSTNELTGITSTSESATRIAYQVREKNNGGTTGVQTPADVISGLDYTVPAWGSGITAASSVDGLSIVLTSSEALFLSNDFADWTVAGAASTPSVNAISGSGTTTITLTLSAAIANGETITLDFADTDTNLRDAAGNPVGDIGSPISVTNNVPSAGITIIETQGADPDFGTPVTITFAETLQENDLVVVYSVSPENPPAAGTVNTSGYTERYRDGNAARPGYGVWTKVMGATPDTSVEVETKVASFFSEAIIVRVYRGVDTTTPFDASPVRWDTGANLTGANPAPITTVTNNAKVIAIGGWTNNRTPVSYSAGYGNTFAQAGTTFGTGALIMLCELEKATAGIEDPGSLFVDISARVSALTLALRPA